ncbi:MAG: hypothetical protein ACTHQ3_12765 [Motilibacteraceae bacterium]
MAHMKDASSAAAGAAVGKGWPVRSAPRPLVQELDEVRKGLYARIPSELLAKLSREQVLARVNTAAELQSKGFGVSDPLLRQGYLERAAAELRREPALTGKAAQAEAERLRRLAADPILAASPEVAAAVLVKAAQVERGVR